MRMIMCHGEPVTVNAKVVVAYQTCLWAINVMERSVYIDEFDGIYWEFDQNGWAWHTWPSFYIVCDIVFNLSSIYTINV